MRRFLYSVAGVGLLAPAVVLAQQFGRPGVEAGGRPAIGMERTGLQPAQRQPAAAEQTTERRRPSPYEVPEKAGPWMICCATCTGTDAVYMAEQIAYQLRKDHRLPAYIFNHTDDQRRKEEEAYNQMRKRNPHAAHRRPRFTRRVEQCAVLVGNFDSMDEANEALSDIKKLPPPKVVDSNGKSVLGEIIKGGDGKVRGQPGQTSKVLARAVLNPFDNSFVIPNPKRRKREEKQDPAAEVDPLWEKLNDGRPYSLLENPKNWTLVVKYYQGVSSLRSADADTSGGFLEKLGFGGKSGEVLDGMAKMAESLAKALRQIPRYRGGPKFEAWVLHTRQGSIVTVGGFDAPNDPEMRAMQEHLSRLRLRDKTGRADLDMLQLFARPMPMRVPKFD